MKEHIKRFDSASAANNYAIAAIPFATTILGPNSPTDDQNLVCNESGKKLVNTAGVVTVENAVTLISFSINGTTYYAPSGMTWRQWVASDYAPSGLYISGDTIYDDRGWDLSTSGSSTDENPVPYPDSPIMDGAMLEWFD